MYSDNDEVCDKECSTEACAISKDFDDYKTSVKNCLFEKFCVENSESVDRLFRLYEEDLFGMYEKKWSPGTAAMAIIQGY